MPQPKSLYEELAANFYRWERRGRGVELYHHAVELEAPFLPFPGHRVKFAEQGQDSGAKSTLLSRWSDKVFRALQPPKQEALTGPDRQPDEDMEPLPD